MKPARRYEEVLKVETQTAYSTYDGRGICYDTRLRYANWGGIRYWEHGAFDVLHGGHRNPDGRKGMSKQLGVVCVKSNEYKGKLFTPEGLEVRKTQLVDNPVLWVDREHDMVVNATHYDPLKYACESSPPIPRTKLKVDFPNPVAMNEKWPEIKQWIDWVDAQRNLGGELPESAVIAWNRDRRANNEIMRAWVMESCEPTNAALWLLWNNMSCWAPLVRKYFLKQNKIIREYPWLKTTKPA